MPNLAGRCHYLVLCAKHREKVNYGQHLEMRALAQTMGALMVDHFGRALDIIAQKFKAVKAKAVDNLGWARARFLDALPAESVASIPPGLRAEILKKSAAAAKLEELSGQASGATHQRRRSKSEERRQPQARAVDRALQLRSLLKT